MDRFYVFLSIWSSIGLISAFIVLYVEWSKGVDIPLSIIFRAVLVGISLGLIIF